MSQRTHVSRIIIVIVILKTMQNCRNCQNCKNCKELQQNCNTENCAISQILTINQLANFPHESNQLLWPCGLSTILQCYIFLAVEDIGHGGTHCSSTRWPGKVWNGLRAKFLLTDNNNVPQGLQCIGIWSSTEVNTRPSSPSPEIIKR